MPQAGPVMLRVTGPGRGLSGSAGVVAGAARGATIRGRSSRTRRPRGRVLRRMPSLTSPERTRANSSFSDRTTPSTAAPVTGELAGCAVSSACWGGCMVIPVFQPSRVSWCLWPA